MPSPFKVSGYSPSSGGESGGDSIAGTPKDTGIRVKAFSPDILNHSIDQPLELSFDGGAFINSGTHISANTQRHLNKDKDPFISIKAKSDQKLCPTASTFQPYGLRTNPEGMNYPMVVSSSLQSAKSQASLKAKSGITLSTSSAASSMMADPSSPTSSHGSSGITQLGTFSTDTIVTRALHVRSISGMYSPIAVNLVETCFKEESVPSGSIKYVRFGSDVLARFSDINDAIIAYNHAKVTRVEWSLEYISPVSYAEKVNSNAPFVSSHEGQILLTATFPSGGGFDRAKLESIILDMLAVDGVIYAFQKQLATEAGTLRLIVEYSDVNSASRAVTRLNGAVIRGIKISICSHTPDLALVSPRRPGVLETPAHEHDGLAMALASMSLGSSANPQRPVVSSGYSTVLSPTGRTLVPAHYPVSPVYSGMTVAYGGHYSPSSQSFVSYPSPGIHLSPQYHDHHFGTNSQYSPVTSWVGVGSPGRAPPRSSQLDRFSGNGISGTNGRRQNNSRGGVRAGCASTGQSGQHNVVDISKIRDGIDVRTTIMLRNIPNKVDQETLKSIVDETSRGCYDFMYLRIDFANSCNVGYAFINFDDPWHIIDFVSARAGQRWNKFSSDKVAELNHLKAIQGKDCLIQKFRNSSVMLEHPSYRPKIFFTAPHPRASEEDDFPMPDNPSKMRRSVENAEHVGLFAPRSGQRSRDEQRDHRGQYDRGTPLAALEEFEYDQEFNHDYRLQDRSSHP